MSVFQHLIYRHILFWFPDTEIKQNYRPVWLEGLELDLYLPQHNLGIEVQGTQHHLYIPKYHLSPLDLHNLKLRDAKKRRLCKENRVDLLVLHNFRGIQVKLRSLFPSRTFPNIPKGLKLEVTKYRQLVHKKKRNEWIAFKVKKGHLHPTNKISKGYLDT